MNVPAMYDYIITERVVSELQRLSNSAFDQWEDMSLEESEIERHKRLAEYSKCHPLVELGKITKHLKVRRVVILDDGSEVIV